MAFDDAVRVGGAIEMRRMASASTTGSTSVNIGGFSVPNPITNAAQRRERGWMIATAQWGDVWWWIALSTKPWVWRSVAPSHRSHRVPSSSNETYGLVLRSPLRPYGHVWRA